MAYYDSLIAAWNSTTQPPAGVTGNALTSTMSAQERIGNINAWKQAQPPAPMVVPGYKVYNVIASTEWLALSTINQQLVRDIFLMGTVDASTGTLTRAVMASVFGPGTQSRTNLQALMATYDTPTAKDWCLNFGYPSYGAAGPGNLTVNDARNAGLST